MVCVPEEKREEPEKHAKQAAAEQAAGKGRALVQTRGGHASQRGGKVERDQAQGKGEGGRIIGEKAQRGAEKTESGGNADCNRRADRRVLQQSGKAVPRGGGGSPGILFRRAHIRPHFQISALFHCMGRGDGICPRGTR